MQKLFLDTESDFYQYLTLHGKVSSRTKTNYISWLRFLSKDYSINEDLNQSKIEIIIKEEDYKRKHRNIYKKEKDVRNFYFALKKYTEFLTSRFIDKQEQIVKDEINIIKTDAELTITEKERVLLSRVGQGRFRNELINYWKGCSISRFYKFDILIASHIKPWNISNNYERLDVFNGLLLLPNYDKLFDKGYISFDEKGKMLFSKLITVKERKALHIDNDLKLFRIENNHIEYLRYHNENCLMK